jgi:magnesium transporter
MKGRTETPAVRCFAARANGVHAVQQEEAVRLLMGRSPAEDGAVEHSADTLVWIDIVHPTEEEGRFLRDELGMHPLAVEDCLRGRQRPKLDRYGSYFFLVFYSAALNPNRNRVALNEVHLFLGSSLLVTVHTGKVQEVSKVVAAWRADRVRFNDTGTIAHHLLDTIVDNYFPVLEHFAARLEEIEGGIFEGTPEATVQRAVELRHELVLFRRILSPERDVLNSLVRRDLPLLRPDLAPYFYDVHDHVLRVTEEIDAFRELLTGLLEVQASNAANLLNRTMQTLTAWSIILMSVTVIAGVYGMNFVLMPELEWTWGYPAALGMMLFTGGMLLVFFRRRGWL